MTLNSENMSLAPAIIRTLYENDDLFQQQFPLPALASCKEFIEADQQGRVSLIDANGCDIFQDVAFDNRSVSDQLDSQL